jgi:Restriction endonuclease
MSLPWDNDTWNVAAQIAAAGQRNLAAVLTSSTSSEWLRPMGTADTPLVLRDAAAREAATQQPPLLLQSVVVPGARTSEGQLIVAVTVPWFDIIEMLKKDPNAAFQIPPRKWEEIIAGAYNKAGFEEVTLTPRSGDHGRDVIAVKKGICTIRVIDQVKAFKPPHLVNANDVRALIGVLQTDGAAKACLTTTSDFAPRIKTDPTIFALTVHGQSFKSFASGTDRASAILAITIRLGFRFPRSMPPT